MSIQRIFRFWSPTLLLFLCIVSAANYRAFAGTFSMTGNSGAFQINPSTNMREAAVNPVEDDRFTLNQSHRAVVGINHLDGAATMLDETLSVADSPKFAITAHPQSLTVKQGTDVTLSVSATGIPPLTYQWLSDRRVLRGATKATLTFTNAQPYHSGLYWVRVDAANGAALSREATLRVIPHNDDFANRSILSGYLIRLASGSNYGAGKEEGEPDHGGTSSSVWWSWRAPVTSKVWIDTRESSFDTVLAVYTGHSVSNLTLVASNDQSGEHYASKVIFEAQAGTEYQIAVEGNGREVGGIVMNLYVEHLHFTFLSIEENMAHLELTGFPEGPFVLEASTDLKTWTKIIETALNGGAFENFYPRAKDEVRFYRAYTPQ